MGVSLRGSWVQNQNVGQEKKEELKWGLRNFIGWLVLASELAKDVGQINIGGYLFLEKYNILLGSFSPALFYVLVWKPLDIYKYL